VTRPLLVIDGDSLAHRAYHALPKTFRRAEGRPGNALLGFSNFLVRLWEGEQPRAVLVGWDSLDSPTYRHELFAGYQGGREFDDDLLEQLDLLPELVRAFGFAAAKAPGYEADDFLAAAVRQEQERGGTSVVATSDRDSFQLASPTTTILQPVRGVSELARIGRRAVVDVHDTARADRDPERTERRVHDVISDGDEPFALRAREQMLAGLVDKWFERVHRTASFTFFIASATRDRAASSLQPSASATSAYERPSTFLRTNAAR